MSPLIQSFVLHFGEMGSRWGINRTVAQLYALIVISEQALNADQLVDALHVSRGNVSMGLKELQSWRLIKPVHVPGDRKEYYSADGDIWDMAQKVFEERRKREIDPTLSVLRNILMEETSSEAESYAQGKILEIHDLLELITQWSSELQNMQQAKLVTLMKLGSGVSKILDMKDRLRVTKE